MTLIVLIIIIAFIVTVVWIAASNLFAIKVNRGINTVFNKFRGGNNNE